MPNRSDADTIRILISTDNHVGYNERDPVRGDDSWKTFHEIMELAKERDVDMVLLAGDLFHENKPSRKSMYQVMRSLRMNCYGEKPCELEMLSDASETFAGAFNHVNYEDPDINVAIPVFSIHGNHDDPSGANHLAALDLLQMSGLLNYYGRTPESDNIHIKPVLLQKGSTKLALYGMSNVRDERLFRTFRDGGVKFFQPGQQKDDWFNIMSVHQNHHAYTDTGYLPEHFLPSFLDLVIWGHEHECLIEPRTNTETTFRVSQPGSSVATSLVPGEAVPKHVGLLTITGKDYDLKAIRLKTVRPFKFKEIALTDDKYMQKIAFDHENKTKVHRHLGEIVDAMIAEATDEWMELQRESGEELEEDVEPPLPLIRLRVEYSAPEGGNFDIDNPQRFSSRFVGRVANVTDVVQYYRKRSAKTRKAKNAPEMPDEATMSRHNFDTVKVEKLVEEFLTAQSLTILPQANFSDAVTQFVDKDDRQAMLEFVESSMKDLVTHVIEDRDADDPDQDIDDDNMFEVVAQGKARLEEAFQRGEIKRAKRKGSRKAKPAEWDSDLDGHWEDNIASIVRSDDEGGDDDDDAESVASRPTTARGRGRGRGGKAAAGTTRKTAAAAKKAPAKSSTAKSKKQAVSEDEEDDSDVVMLDDDDDDDDEALFVQPTKKAAASKARTTTSRSSAAAAKTNGSSAKSSTSARGGGKATGGTQSQLSFARPTNGSAGPASRTNGTAARAAAPKRMQEPSEDEISDDDDAFEPPPPSARAGARKR